VRFERVDHWERIASRWRPAFSSHLSLRACGPRNPMKVGQAQIKENGRSHPAKFFVISVEVFLSTLVSRVVSMGRRNTKLEPTLH
jgi:hypothetical protein